MTPMNNADYLVRLEHAEELEVLKAAKRAKGLSYQELAEQIGVNKVWLASAFEGQQHVPEVYCEKLAAALDWTSPPPHFSPPIPIRVTQILFSTGSTRSLIPMAPLLRTLFMSRAEMPL